MTTANAQRIAGELENCGPAPFKQDKQINTAEDVVAAAIELYGPCVHQHRILAYRDAMFPEIDGITPAVIRQVRQSLVGPSAVSAVSAIRGAFAVLSDGEDSNLLIAG